MDINILNLVDFEDPPTPPLWHYRKPISDIMSISDIEDNDSNYETDSDTDNEDPNKELTTQ